MHSAVGIRCLLLTLTVVLFVHVQNSLCNPKPMLINSAKRSLDSLEPVTVAATSMPDTPVPLPRQVNRTRIAEMKPYRLQRKLSPPTSMELVEIGITSQSVENDEPKAGEQKKRKPKRKLLHYRGSSKPAIMKPKITKDTKIDKAGKGKLTEKMKEKLKTILDLENDVSLKRQSIILHDDDQNENGYLHYPHFSHKPNDKQNKYSKYAIDPAHPAVLAITRHNPLAPFRPIPPPDLGHPGSPPNKQKPDLSSIFSVDSHHPSSNYSNSGTPLKKKKMDLFTSLLPLDKSLLYAGMAFSWAFWLLVALVYYSWGDKYRQDYQAMVSIVGKKSDQELTMSQKPIIVKLEPGKPAQFFQTRALQGNSFNFARVLDMIAMAQETYEKFDFQSLDCQKKALCELQQKQEDFGETGRKISDTFSFMDSLDGLPMPAIIQRYLKEYREAIVQGRSSTKDCATIYPKCSFSIKEVFVKYSKKARKQL